MVDKAQLLGLLELYYPNDLEQQKTKEQIKQFVINHEDCFLRTNNEGHITASSWLLSPERSHVLLTHHKKIGRWIQLGGHADGDSDVLRVAKREAEEESGIKGIEALDGMIFDVDIHGIDEHAGVSAHKHYDIRFVLRAPHQRFMVSDESYDLAWLSVFDLAGRTKEPSLARMARKWLEKLSN
jgi:8-oxo-dGTP pyrophosphatase MutT (NUDIX family)